MTRAECCRNCVYVFWKRFQTLIGMGMGWPLGESCANRPGHYGQLVPTPIGKVCPNYRLRPPDPGAGAERIILTNGMVAYVDAADYDEISQYSWCLVSGGYAGRYENGKCVLMHRQIMNPPEGMQVDHIRRNRLDNTRAHLRVCTPAENARNRSKSVGASSRYFGVTYNKRRKKWVASLKVEGRVKEVGFSYDEKEAARAHDYAAVLYFGDYVRLNFPEEWPPERRAQVRAQRDAAVAGANDPSPAPRPEDRKRKTAGTKGGKRKKAKRKTPAAPRKTTKGRKPRATKKKSHAGTQGPKAKDKEETARPQAVDGSM